MQNGEMEMISDEDVSLFQKMDASPSYHEGSALNPASGMRLIHVAGLGF
jgi:hypothetical protein